MILPKIQLKRMPLKKMSSSESQSEKWNSAECHSSNCQIIQKPLIQILNRMHLSKMPLIWINLSRMPLSVMSLIRMTLRRMLLIRMPQFLSCNVNHSINIAYMSVNFVKFIQILFFENKIYFNASSWPLMATTPGCEKYFSHQLIHSWR